MTVISIAGRSSFDLSSGTDCRWSQDGTERPATEIRSLVAPVTSMGPVRSETITLAPGEIGAAEQSAWRELGNQAAEPNPFYEPEFMMPAFRRLGLRGAGLRVVREGRDWVACLPVSGAAVANASLVGL